MCVCVFLLFLWLFITRRRHAVWEKTAGNETEERWKNRRVGTAPYRSDWSASECQWISVIGTSRKRSWMTCFRCQRWSEICCTSSNPCSSFMRIYEHIYIISNVSLLLASASACSSVTMVTAVRLGWQRCESKHLCFTVAPDASENQKHRGFPWKIKVFLSRWLALRPLTSKIFLFILPPLSVTFRWRIIPRWYFRNQIH